MKVGFFEETPGVRSSTRLVFIVGSFAIIILAGYMAFLEYSPVEIGVFFAAAIAALGGTKFFGTRNEQTSDKTTEN